jgi:hypothetical protein
VRDGSSSTSFDSSNMQTVAGFSLAMCMVAALFTFLLIRLIVSCAGVMIQVSLALNVVFAAILALAGFAAGSIVVGIIGLVFAGLAALYMYLVQKRIPFAKANLIVACEAVKAHASLYCVAFFIVFLQIAWILVWTLAFVGIADDLSKENIVNPGASSNGASCVSNGDCQSNSCAYQSDSGRSICQSDVVTAMSGVVYFFLLVSFFWGIQVVKNIAHVSIAGTVASWWFHSDHKGATASALKRAFTTSLGSICLGSLIVAILQALKQMAREAQRSGDSLACIAVCILGCIERLLELFNKWAFVYVGVYGYKFTQAGKAVFELFKARGFEVIINDDLIGNVISLTSLAVGLLCAGLGVAFHYLWTDLTAFDNAPIILGILGFLVGLGVSSIPKSWSRVDIAMDPDTNTF